MAAIDRDQANALIDFHQPNLILSQEISTEITARIDAMRAEVNAKMPTYLQACERELFAADNRPPTEGTNPLPAVTLPDDELLTYLAAIGQLRSLAKQVQRLDRSGGSQISRYIEYLRPATSRLAWFFAGSQKKAAAVEAFTQLDQLAHGPVATEYAQAREDYQHISLIDAHEARHDFESHRAGYQSTFRIAYGHSPEATPAQLRELGQHLNDVEHYQTLVDYHCTEISQQISANIAELQTQAAIEGLTEISFDSLRVDIERLRVKTLHDAGYHNAYDIYRASQRQLESISGISRAGAAELKATVARYLRTLQENTNIRIDPDNRSAQATAVVVGTYQYLRLAKYGEKLRKLQASIPEKVRKHISTITQLQAPGWSLLDSTQKRELRAAVAYLDENFRNYPAPRAELEPPSAPVAWADFTDNSIEYYNLLEKLVPGVLGNGDSTYGLPDELVAEIANQELDLEGLACSLRRYQEWGVKYVLSQKSVILGDEMGLGKTIQALAAMVALRNTGQTHFMVVCPAAVLVNWVKEVSGKSDLAVTKLHGNDRDLAFNQWLENGGVAVTTYETVRNFRFPVELCLGMLVVDEAHYVKNPDAQRTQALQKIIARTQRHLLMTGTALENHVDEMITLVGMLRPDLARSLVGVAHMITADIFREKVAAVYLRRKREDVLGELPDLIENTEWCELNQAEWLAYEELAQKQNFMTLRRVSWNVLTIKHSEKAKRLKEIVKRARGDGRKIIVFSYFLSTLATVQQLLGDICLDPISGSVTPERRQEIIDEFNDADAGSVLVSQVQSGGTGLNIQTASVVVFCEPQLKPSMENQAISRAYRMGQARNVLVYRLLSEHSIDERIMQILDQKQAIFNSFADESVAAEKQALVFEQAGSADAAHVEVDVATQGEILRAELERINSDDASMFSPA